MTNILSKRRKRELKKLIRESKRDFYTTHGRDAGIAAYRKDKNRSSNHN